MTEPDVALTDFALTLECTVFALWLYARGAPVALRGWLVVFFAAAALASLAGGVVHGFFADPASLGTRVLWPVALFAIGAAALAGWAIAAQLALSASAARAVILAACAQLAVYAAVLLAGRQTFLVAIVDYLPATLFLLAAVAWRARRRDLPGSALAGVGLALTLAAPLMQQARVDLHPVWLTHNALYHAMQALGFVLFFAGSRRWVAVCPHNEEVSC